MTFYESARYAFCSTKRILLGATPKTLAKNTVNPPKYILVMPKSRQIGFLHAKVMTNAIL